VPRVVSPHGGRVGQEVRVLTEVETRLPVLARLEQRDPLVVERAMQVRDERERLHREHVGVLGRNGRFDANAGRSGHRATTSARAGGGLGAASSASKRFRSER
jgi:hypothetical protein